ncbi:hypothetical protein CHU94_15445 [Rhodoferax sp. TH121]|uniref:DUF1800 domain-containing protein n=1 Tax=Rhodoferax sp. TH121 TaxID=2022803 RepID=UPI000B96A86C|nr:DUF1800 domain-containing protein [Rhodoferax sp. TH121]OYQ38829.1 hypothetical protein CHU94_15445 [Rhodoferax sp. TH121]
MRDTVDEAELATPPQTRSSPQDSAALTAVALAAAAALAACGGGGGDGGDTTEAPVGGRTISLRALPAAIALSGASISAEQASRFLQQAQFSASDADIAQVRNQGYAAWIEGQVALNFGTRGWDWLNSQGYGDASNTNNYYDQSYPADYMVWNQLLASSDPMRKRIGLALSEFFVVSLSGLDFRWRSHAMAHYWDTLCAYAFGNFRGLLEAVTLHVAMGYYLNTKGNKKENNSGRQPDENYAREVMQLFTVGLHLLNPDGTQQLDGNGKPQDTYTASDVSNLARVFTGYDVDMSQNVNVTVNGNTVGNTAFARLPMVLTASNHSTLAATFLGTTIPANTPGAAALKTALDTLFNHQNTAPFFCKQMIQRLVTSNPSPAYVGRVAAVFADNGQGVRGDLAYVFAAILLDDEARNATGLSALEYGKLREPMLRLAQWGRTFGVGSASGAWKIGDLSNAGTQLSQSPLRAPSVFNFFRPGYVPPSTALSNGVVAPEFQLVTESSVGGYLNYMMGVIDNGFNSRDIYAAYSTELTLVLDPAALVRRLNLLLCAGQLSASTQTVIVNALLGVTVSSNSSAALKRQRVCAAVLMVMACPEYLIQK